MTDSFTLRRIARIYAAAALLLAFGTFGLELILHESLLNAFYRTVVTGGRLWGVFVVLGGVTIFAYVGAAVVEAIAGGILSGALAERRRWKTINAMRDHFMLDLTDVARQAVAERGDVFLEGTGSEEEVEILELEHLFASREALAG